MTGGPSAKHPERPLPRRGELEALKLLALRGATASPIHLSSRELGEALGVRQQTADNYLLSLHSQGYLTRTLGERKQILQLTSEGIARLRREYQELRQVFEESRPLLLRGLVVSGLGEGRYYLSKPGYVSQFRGRLGYTPFPGTLNVRLRREDIPRVDEFRLTRGERIEGFEAEGRSFGGAQCYPARVRTVPCHLVIPDRTHYTDVLEFIAPVSLRDTLGLKDQDEVEIHLGAP